MKKIFATAAAGLVVSALVGVSLSSCSLGEGKSAYELAVENGYTGTQSEWLDSLKGDSLDINDIYATARENGFTGTFLEFLKEYMDGDVTINENYYSDASFNAEGILSLVSITCEFTEKKTTGGFFGNGGTTTETIYILGSGVIYSLDKSTGDAYVITNYHIVYDLASTQTNHISDNINLYLYGQEYAGSSESEYIPDYSIPATFVGGSMQNDIAVLKVTGSDVLKASSAKAATFASSNDISVGDAVYTVGNAEGDGISVCKGIVSVDSEYIKIDSIDETTTVSFREIRTDATVNSGNSGGALFNANGEVIGIVNAKSVKDTVENIGYALPSSLALNVANNVIDNCDGTSNVGANRATMGITLTTSSSKAVYDTQTNKVSIVEESTVMEVSPSSVADGKLKVGDIIKQITLGDTTIDVTRRFMIIDEMYNVRMGDTLKITVSRNGQLVEVSLVFDSANYFTTIA